MDSLSLRMWPKDTLKLLMLSKMLGRYVASPSCPLLVLSKFQDCGTCDNTQAGTASRDRPSKKTRVSGIGAFQCIHGLFRRHGVIDFVKGER